MFKLLSKRLAAAAAVLVLAAGWAGAGANAQNTQTQVLDVAPGERRCMTHTTPAYMNATVYDYVVAGAAVKFILLAKTLDGAEFNPIRNSGPYPVFSFYAREDAAPAPPQSSFDFFPGFFRTCARNEGYSTATVSLSITVDQ